jgi:hypothetical protein
MGRPALRKKGPMTAAERQRRRRRRLRAERRKAEVLAKREENRRRYREECERTPRVEDRWVVLPQPPLPPLSAADELALQVFDALAETKGDDEEVTIDDLRDALDDLFGPRMTPSASDKLCDALDRLFGPKADAPDDPLICAAHSR